MKPFRNKLLALVMSAALLAPCLHMQAQAAGAFTDVPNNWAHDSIVRCADAGWMYGVGGTKFSPNSGMTRAMFVTVLARLNGAELSAYTGTAFSDVPTGTWYSAAVQWAAANGIVNGVSPTAFQPNRAITRQEIAVMFVRYSNYIGHVLPRVRAGKMFADTNQCADFALDAVYTLYCSGVVNGVPGNKFNPRANASRAECAVMLCNYFDAVSAQTPDAQRVPLIAHRGYSARGPENTLPAFALAAQMGYAYAETDVLFTKDSVPVCLHDETIDRTSNGSGAVNSYTYEQLQQFDFGNAEFPAVIPTYAEYLDLCARSGMTPVVELKSQFNDAQIEQLVSIANEYGITGNILWISFYSADLVKLSQQLPGATLAFLPNKVSDQAIQTAKSLQNGKNTVYLSVYHGGLTAERCASFLRSNVPLMVWTVDDISTAVKWANSSCQFITTNAILEEQLYP